eukprot:12417693-Karenia_brevis.AAC.1
MLLSPEEWGRVVESSPSIKPYMDERLASDPELYYEFVADIFAAGMIGFTAQALDIVTPFFVKKKDGKQRL